MLVPTEKSVKKAYADVEQLILAWDQPWLHTVMISIVSVNVRHLKMHVVFQEKRVLKSHQAPPSTNANVGLHQRAKTLPQLHFAMHQMTFVNAHLLLMLAITQVKYVSTEFVSVGQLPLVKMM